MGPGQGSEHSGGRTTPPTINSVATATTTTITTTITTTMTQAHHIQLENGQSVAVESHESKHFDAETDFDALPVVDLEGMFSANVEDRRRVALALDDACRNVGFMYVVNHGIPSDVVADAFAAAADFFALPEAVKMEVYTGLAPVDRYTGYHPLGGYNRGGRRFADLSEAFNWNYDPADDPSPPPAAKGAAAAASFPNMWPAPAHAPALRSRLTRYHAECLTLARRLIRLVALALALPEDYFDGAVEAPSAGMRILHYPPQQHAAADQNGIGPHTDFQVLTFVNQGAVGGLQVLNKRGQWVQAPPLEGALVVNVGDCLMRASNDRYVSTVHRVVNVSGADRLSIPFFFGFDHDHLLAPIPGCVSASRPARYEPMTAGEYVRWRGRVAKTNSKQIRQTLESESESKSESKSEPQAGVA